MLKEINPECSLEGLILQLKLQYFGHLMRRASVQFSSVAQLCLTLRLHGLQHARLRCPSPTPRACSNSCLLSWCHPLFLLPSIFPSIGVFSNESVLCIRWPKYWSFNFSISSSHEYSGLISFRMDWFDLLAVQGTLKSLLQHHFFFLNFLYFNRI